MDIQNVPTKIFLKGKPITKWIKNKDAKTIATMLRKNGYKESDIRFAFDNHETHGLIG